MLWEVFHFLIFLCWCIAGDDEDYAIIDEDGEIGMCMIQANFISLQLA